VVVSLAPEIATRSAKNVRAFETPTVVYFTTVLVVSALMTIPHLAPAASSIGRTQPRS
jgi:hypothetical protein